MISTLICLVALQDVSPFVQIESPSVLYRTMDPSDPAFERTNEALRRLSRMSRKRQIAAQLAFIERAKDPAFESKGGGRRYEWRPVWDMAKLDVIRVALGKKPHLLPKTNFFFLQRDASMPVGIKRRANLFYRPEASFDFRRPGSLRSPRTFEVAKRLILKGAFVIPRT